MKSLLFYIIQVIIGSGLLYGYYYMALRNGRFHHYNRYYLITATLLSIVIPFLNIPVYFTDAEKQSSAVIQTLTTFSFQDTPAQMVATSSVNAASWLTTENIIYCVYLLISCIILTKIILSLVKISRIKKNNPVEKIGDISFVNTNEPGTPFSFFRWLFWNKNIELTSSRGEQIFKHELFHIRHKHSHDIIFIELLTMIFWINPFFHLIRRETKAVHEFLADKFAVTKNQEWQYAELLLMQALNTQHHLVTPFFHNQIKRRVAMITSSQKTSHQYLRKVLVLPLAAVILALFAFSYQTRKANKTNITPASQPVDTTHPPVIYLTEEVGYQWKLEKKSPPENLLDSWADAKTYGVWIDNKRINNDLLPRYKGSDFSYYTVSKLEKNAINYGKHYYQVNLMTNDYYSKSFSPNQKIKVWRKMPLDTLPKKMKPYENALVVINGKVSPYKVSELDGKMKILPDEIAEIRILRDTQATDKYGDQGKNGVIEIITKKKGAPTVKEITLEDKSIDDNKVFVKVEVEAAFPGGEKAWKDFLTQNLSTSFLDKTTAPKGTYTVWIQFIVKKDGSLSDFKALTSHGYGMEEEALRVMKKSPDWLPAVQNGQNVTAYRKQPFTFVVDKSNISLSRPSIHQMLVIIDGQEKGRIDDFKELEQWITEANQIKSVTINTGESAIKKYGEEKGKNGVIEIFTKQQIVEVRAVAQD